ncbi:AI-2E family transporter [Microbacterium sp.]|uniref:AI-2E family transporter n=1 Tax=Microbacterium sp. TaxID=51671 RepID=UPI003A838FCB
MARSTPPAAWRPSAATQTLVALAAAVVVLVGIHLGQSILAPMLLAVVLVIICHPLRHPLERRGWPSWAATTAVIVAAYAVIGGLAALLAYAGIEFTGLIIDVADQLRRSAGDTIAWLTGLGVHIGAADSLTGIIDPATLTGFAASLGSATLSVLTALFFVLAYIIFMAADGGRYSRAEAELGPGIGPVMRRIDRFTGGVRRYYVVNAIFGALVAVIDGLALWMLQVPAPAVWAILAFVTNFVPNIGFVLGVIPPAVLALVVGGWPLLLAVVAIYCVVNVTLQVLIQPKFVSDAVDLSLTLSFVSVVFWTFVIGPLGAILAIPLTLLTRALLLEGDPGARRLRWFSGERTDTDAPPG